VSIRTKLTRAAVIGAVAALGFGLAAPAANAVAPATSEAKAAAVTSAADPSWSVSRTIKRWKWYEGGGKCNASATATYTVSTGKLVVNASASVSSSVKGCKAQARLTANTTAGAYPITVTIPTVCSTSDPTCPTRPDAGESGRGSSFDVQTFGFPGTFLSVTNLVVELR
jgi:hypothetical protein